MNIVYAFMYVAANLGIKFLLLLFFMFVCGGFQMLSDDIAERDRYEEQFYNRARRSNYNEFAANDAFENLQTDAFQQIFEQRDEEDGKLSCAICLNDFRDEDNVTVLKCDKRHIYHPDCIREALRSKLECPLCR